jgi:hypothetical protein
VARTKDRPIDISFLIHSVGQEPHSRLRQIREAVCRTLQAHYGDLDALLEIGCAFLFQRVKGQVQQNGINGAWTECKG